MCKRLLLVLLILFSLFIHPTVLPAKNETGRIKELGKKVQAIDAKSRSEGQRLKAIDKNISILQDEISSVRKEVRFINEKIVKLQRQIKYYQQALSESKGMLKRKWIAFYKGAYLDIMDMLYSHSEYSGYVEAIISKNQEELMEYKQTKSQLLNTKNKLDEASKAQKENLVILQRKITSLNSERSKKSILLASLGKQKLSYQEEIQRLLKELRARKSIAPNRGMAKKNG